MTQGEMDWCKNCKYKEFYNKFKSIAEYVEKEADKRIAKMIEEGKVRKR